MTTAVLSIVAAAATGAGLSLYSRVAWPWCLLGWVMLVPWLAALDRQRSLGASIGAGLLMAVVLCVAVFPWLPQMIADYSGASYGVAAFVFVAATPFVAPQFVVFAAARRLARDAAPGSWLAAAAIASGFYVGAEWGLPKVMGDTLGHGQLPAAWIRQSADLFGAHGITVLLLLVNEAILELLRRLGRAPSHLAAPLAVAVAIIATTAAYGALRVHTFDLAGTAPLRVAAVQANVSHYDRLREEVGTFDAVELVLEKHFALSAEAASGAELDLLLWPETVYPTTFGVPKSADGAAFDRAIAAFVQRLGVPLVFGTYDAEGGAEYNAAVLLEPRAAGGVELDVYRKTRLFPFTEYLPAPLDTEWLRRRLPWAGTWRPGDGARVLPIRLRDGRTLRAAPLICYDAIDPGLAIAAVRAGAEVLLTLSNDSWFDYPGGRELILAVSSFRSIETRRPQVRATPTGLTAVVDPLGETLAVAAPNQARTLVAEVHPTAASTVVLRLGNWLPPAALAGAVLALGTLRRRGRGRRRGATHGAARGVEKFR